MERYDTKDTYHAWYEHWHRYHWLTSFVKSKTVADLACGEGYGSALLAQFADTVIGMDIDADTIQQAQSKYQNLANLSYQQTNILDTPLAPDTIDMIVSFETLEHLIEQQQLLIEFQRILKTNGTLVISTPDTAIYSGNQHHNEFHLKELTQREFFNLIESHFSHVLYFGQQFQTNSVITPQHSQTSCTPDLYVTQGKENQTDSLLEKPTYLIAIASNSGEALTPFKNLGSSHFNDSHNSLFKHYERQIKRLLEADQHIQQLEGKLALQNQVIDQLKARLGL